MSSVAYSMTSDARDAQMDGYDIGDAPALRAAANDDDDDDDAYSSDDLHDVSDESESSDVFEVFAAAPRANAAAEAAAATATHAAGYEVGGIGFHGNGEEDAALKASHSDNQGRGRLEDRCDEFG